MKYDKLIDVQTILSRKDLKIMRIKIAKDAKLAEHSVDSTVIVTVVKGQGVFTLNGVDRLIAQSDVVDLHPNELHAVFANDDLELVVVKMNLKSNI